VTGEAVQASLDYAATWLVEDQVLLDARQRAAEVGAVPVGPGSGALLRVLAAAVQARAVVEVGTGCGVSGVWLLRGMADDGVLTSIDVEPEHQRLARQAFEEAGFPANRTRLIGGQALAVLPKLTDGGYDLVFVDANKNEYPRYLVEALRLLRPGGVLAVDNALWHDRVADPAVRDPETTAVRELLAAVRDDGALVAALVPAGDGLLVAVRR
jgi:predicted O-methyltransferase YrrM